MPVLQARTRLQIRQAVGHLLGAVSVSVTTSAGGDASTLPDTTLRGGENEHKGKWIVATSGDNAGQISRVSSNVEGGTPLIISPAFTATVPTAMTYELWDEKYPPARINEFINQALIEITGLAFDPEESVALHADGRQTRFDIPTQFSILNRIEYRSAVESKTVHLATTAWDESVDSDVTASQDTKDYKLAPGSFKMVVAAGASAADILATKAFTALNLSGYDYVEFWIKSTVAESAGGLQLLLGNTASCASPLETLSIPALTADTWTYVRIALANPELDTAIISVGLKYVTDIGACTIWINDIKAVLDGSAVWHRLDPNSWRVDELNRDLILSNAGRAMAGYRLLKLCGGDKPALLSADATACEVDDQFVIAKATELAAIAASGGPNTDPDALRQLAGYWGARAAEAKRGQPLLVNARMVG